MDVKDRRHRSLTRGRCGKECRYTSSSLDSEDCRVPTQKSYSSSETLKAYDHDSRMHYGNRVTDLVHRESDEFPRQVYLVFCLFLRKHYLYIYLYSSCLILFLFIDNNESRLAISNPSLCN
ncbi:hypothetical protein K5549_014894 [Capra hircus]|nr:hypothetical protein K5549_014894 [Capra hircus]